MNSEPYRKQHFEPLGRHMNQMDYAAYFNAAQQPHEFGGSLDQHTAENVMNSDEFPYQSPPQNVFDFQTFDAHNHFNSLGNPKPPTPQSKSCTSIAPNSQACLDMAMDSSSGAYDTQQARRGSNSGNEEDEENMTPAQSRRKAQNRAAQRAFRERKEKHVKDLEAQLAALRASTSSITTENERLRLSLQKVSTENEILKATSSIQHAAAAASNREHASPPDTTGPMHFSPKDFYNDLLSPHEKQTPSHRVVRTETGGRLMGVGATWDYILGSKEFRTGSVDVGRVSAELKGRARCDGQGPVFEEGDVRRAMRVKGAEAWYVA